MSLILKGFCNFIFQTMLLLSILFLIRGHNYPGGGFIGALIASTAIGLYILSYKKAPKFISYNPPVLIILGILCLITSILLAMCFQKNLLTGIWWTFYFYGEQIKLGTPLLFDIGIYLSILGSLSWIISILMLRAK